MEEISGCDSTSSNAIQAGLACPWRFLTAGTLPAGLGLPVLTRPPHMLGSGWGGFLLPSTGRGQGKGMQHQLRDLQASK